MEKVGSGKDDSVICLYELLTLDGEDGYPEMGVESVMSKADRSR